MIGKLDLNATAVRPMNHVAEMRIVGYCNFGQIHSNWR